MYGGFRKKGRTTRTIGGWRRRNYRNNERRTTGWSGEGGCTGSGTERTERVFPQNVGNNPRLRVGQMCSPPWNEARQPVPDAAQCRADNRHEWFRLCADGIPTRRRGPPTAGRERGKTPSAGAYPGSLRTCQVPVPPIPEILRYCIRIPISSNGSAGNRPINHLNVPCLLRQQYMPIFPSSSPRSEGRKLHEDPAETCFSLLASRTSASHI